MSFLFSTKELLSLISADWIQDLIWSRSLCSFLISFLRSVSYFSFWLLLAALWTFCQISSKSSTPSVTFFRHLSISPGEKSIKKDKLAFVNNQRVNCSAAVSHFGGKTRHTDMILWPVGNLFCSVKPEHRAVDYEPSRHKLINTKGNQ